MGANAVTFETVRQIALALPGVEDSTAYTMPALKLHGDLLASIPSNRFVEPNSLVVRVPLEDRPELLTADPAVYYVTDHYVAYDAVLVRLPQITPEALEGLLKMAHRYVSTKPKSKKR